MLNKKIDVKSVLIGFFIALLVITPVITVDAAGVFKNLKAYYNDIKLYVNGFQYTPRDVNGKIVEPFIVGGTTYLPVRAVSQALGQNVEWDAKTNSVYIGTNPETITEVKLGDSFSWEGFFVTLGADTKWSIVNGKFSKHDGEKAYGVSVKFTNISSEPQRFSYGNINRYYPSGKKEDDDVDYWFKDGTAQIPYLKPGDTAQGFLYLVYEHDGTYYLEFNNNGEIIRVPVPITI